MNLTPTGWIVISVFAIFVVLPLAAYLVSKFSAMGRLSGIRSFNSIIRKQEKTRGE